MGKASSQRRRSHRPPSHSTLKFRDELSAEDTLRQQQRKKGARSNADALV